MFDEQSGAYRMQALLKALRAYKRSQGESSMFLNGSADEIGRVDKDFVGERLTMADAARAAVADSRSPSERSLLMLKRPRFFWSKQRQPSEQKSEELTGGTCDIRHSPNRIFKAAENGNMKQFENLYKMDPTRLEYRNSKGRTCIHFAASANRCAIIQFIVDHGGNLNIQDNDGNTALHEAARTDAADAVCLLLQLGADCTTLNSQQYAPLHVAAQLEKVKALEAIAKFIHLIDSNIRGKHGRTPLHVAAIHDRAKSVEILLINMNGCPKRTCDNGYTSVHEAARNACSKALEALIVYGEQKGHSRTDLMALLDAEGNVPLHSAVHAGDPKVVELCMAAGGQLCAQQHDQSTPLHLACAQGAIEIVRLMRSAQPNASAESLMLVDAQQMSPLHCAAMFDHDELLELLVSTCMSSLLTQPDRQGRTVLLLAAARGAWKCVHMLLQKPNLSIDQRDSNGRNLLHHTVLNGGNVHSFTSIIQQRADASCLSELLNERDQTGCTPLHYAAKEGSLRSIHSLLQLGASINPKNNEIQSPLHLAARYGRFHTVKRLLGSPRGHLIINEMDGEGMTCLHIAASHGHSRIVQLLLQRGALLHRDHRGRTPLHYSASGEHIACMQQLLAVHSHLLDQVDRDGNSALHLAATRARSSAANMLLSLDCRLRRNYNECSPMDLALQYKHSNVMRTFVLHSTRGHEILHFPTRIYPSLIEGLVASMPEVMSALLDRGIQPSGDQSQNSNMYRIRYAFDCLRHGCSTERPLPVLNLMVKYGREELMCHPLCLKYLESKWNTYGMYCHTTYLLIYIAFLTCLTNGVLQLVDLPQHAHIFGFLPAFVHVSTDDESPFSSHSMANMTASGQILQLASIQLSGEPKSNWSELSRKLPSQLEHNPSFSTYLCCAIVLLFNMFSVMKELHQMFQQRAFYLLNIVNLMLWVLYGSSTFMAIGLVFPDSVNSSFIYIVAAIATFLAWFNCLLYFQRFNSAGIYVVMFFEILLTLVRVLIVFCVLIIAFGLSFYILLTKCQQRKGFHNVPMSIVRIITMMLGEMDFLSTFLQPLLDFRAVDVVSRQMIAATWFLIVFAVLMPILLMNLLIGLAVGDIETVRSNAQMKRLTMQVQMHSELERRLPKRFLHGVDKAEVFDYPNQGGPSTSQILSTVYNFFRHNKAATPISGSKKASARRQVSQGTGSTNELTQEIQKQRNRMRSMSRSIEQQLQLIKMLAKKMDISTENDLDEIHSDVSEDETATNENHMDLNQMSKNR